MSTVEEPKEKILRVFRKYGEEGQASLIEVFGKEYFALPRWEDITTLDLAFAAVGLSQTDPRFTSGTADDIAYQTLKLVIVPSMNRDIKIDYEDEDQKKWWPVFYLNKPGFRFHRSGCGVVRTGMTGGSRLAFADQGRSDHAAKYFTQIFQDFYCEPVKQDKYEDLQF